MMLADILRNDVWDRVEHRIWNKVFREGGNGYAPMGGAEDRREKTWDRLWVRLRVRLSNPLESQIQTRRL